MATLRDLFEPAVLQILTAYYITINQPFHGNTSVLAHAAAQPLTKKAGSVVTIRVNQSWLDNALNPADPAYPDIRDGLIFESFNVQLILGTSAVQDQFKTSNESLADYGARISDLESATVFHSSQVYEDLVANGIALSQKGTNQLQAAQGFAPNNTLQEYKAHTLVSPHEAGAQNYMQLLTPQMYQFEWIALTGGQVIAKKIKTWAEAAIKASLGKQLDPLAWTKYYDPVAKFIDTETSKPNFSSGASGDENMKKRVREYNAIVAAVATKPKCAALSAVQYQCPTY